MTQSIEDMLQQLASTAQGWPVAGAPTQTATDWRAFWADCAKAGLMRLGVPEEYGGHGASARDVVDAMIGLGEICLDNALPMGLNSQIWVVQEPLLRFGSEAQKQRYLPPLLSGDMVAGFAMTEHASGSDAMSLATRAERVDGGYVLNGDKCYIGFATECDMAIVFASTAPERKSWGLTAFLVEKGDAGFIQGPEQPKIGLTSVPMGELRFDNCTIPEDRRLGPEGAGAALFQATMDLERSFLFASQVGAMKRQLRDTTQFANTREVFGGPIITHQSVSNRLADMALRLETCMLMQHKSATLKDSGKLTAIHAAMTKLHLSEAFMASSLDAMRIRGGAGYLAGSQAGDDMKDALGGVIYSGTSDVQRNMIARLIGTQN